MPAPVSTISLARRRVAAAGGRLMAANLPEPVAALLAPYPQVIGALNERGRLSVYPGSPSLAPAWLRPRARLIACEIEPKAAASLGRHLRGDNRIKTLAVDGWTALSAYVPPPERRGLVLVDPPFEEEADFHRLSHGLATAHRKWATGTYALWYPIKGRSQPDALAKRLCRLGIGKILRAGLSVAPPSAPTRLNFWPYCLPWRRSWAASARAVLRSIGLLGRAEHRSPDVATSFHRNLVGV